MLIRTQDAKFIKETDKAVCFEVEINYEFNASSSLYTTKTRKANIWIPKSQLDKDGNPAEWIWRKNVEKAAQELNPFRQSWGWAYDIKTPDNPNLKPFKTEREIQWQKERELKIGEKLNKAERFRNELIAELKGAGVKGIHGKMKSDTLIKKAREVDINANEIMIKHGYAPRGYDLEFIKKNATTLKAIKPSSAITRDYMKMLQKVTKEINNSVSWWALANINKNLDKNTPKQLTIEFNKLLKEWQGKINKSAVNIARRLQRQLKGYVDINLQAQLENTPLKDSAKSALAITPPLVKSALTTSYEANIALIKSIPSDIIERYKQGFLQGITNFDREALLKLARQYEGISYKRAKLIARDQVAKGISNYQNARAQELGFKYYMWITSNDERVSKGEGGHIYLNNRIYAYDNPTAIIDSHKNKGHPAVRVNCRCSAISVMPSPTQELKLVKDSAHGDYYELVEKS